MKKKTFNLSPPWGLSPLLGRYDEALHEWQWVVSVSQKNAMRQGRPNNGEAELKAQEIRALKSYKENGNVEAVYDHLKLYMRRKFKLLPPSFEWGAGSTEALTVLRLYDTIGDYDAGIAFIDESLQFLKKNEEKFGADPKIYEIVKTADEAAKCAELDKRMSQRNPNWRSCNLIREYLLIREAFEAEKKAGGPTCKGQPNCIGDATKALIQSDYFPW